MRRAAEIARDLVATAGRRVRALQGEVTARDKGGALGPVTEADFAAERILLAGLRTSYPDDAILSEESHPQVEPGRARIWCVDPVDGTREYAEGRGEYTVQVGLLVRGRPVAGAVAVPAQETVFWGWAGGGVLCDEEPVRMPAMRSLERAIAIHSRSHRAGNREALARLGVHRSIEMGGAGYKVVQLLMGRAHLYVHARAGTRWWDSVAPAALVLAAGGYVGNAQGGALEYANGSEHQEGLLFAVPGLGEAAAARLRDS